METVHTIGRRKASVARLYITEGKGNFVINGKDYKDYFEFNGVKKEVEELIELNVKKALTGLNMIPTNNAIQLNDYAKLILNRKF